MKTTDAFNAYLEARRLPQNSPEEKKSGKGHPEMVERSGDGAADYCPAESGSPENRRRIVEIGKP